jgi:hypothetical protein
VSEPAQTPLPRPDAPRSWQLRTLALVLLLEALGLAGITIVLLLEVVAGAADDITSALALILVTGIMTAGMFAIVVGTWRARPWIRGAATTVQILLVAVAVGSFQGAFARVDIGWLLLAPALVALVLLFTGPVIAATKRQAR